MKILLVNEYTAIKGGVDTVVNSQIVGLKKNGIDVKLYSLDHNQILSNSKAHILKYLFKSYQYWKFNLYIKKNKPDIIHFHNIYPLWGKPFWAKITNGNIKIIQHIHNFYPFCLNSFFYSRQKICIDCYKKNSWFPGVKKKCYNNSYLYTLISTLSRPLPKKWLAFSNNVNLFIGVSDFIVKKYIELGVNKNKIIKLENSISNHNSFSDCTGDYILYLGNVVIPKGAEIVCRLAEEIPYIKFILAGDGKDLKMLKKKYGNLNNLEFRGYIEREDKIKLLQHCRFMILPTLLWESFGLVILEAFQHGKPVLTTGEGATSELVQHKYTGIIVNDHTLDNIKKKTLKFWNELEMPNDYKKNCLKKSEQFSLTIHIDKLINIYNNLLNN